MHDFERKRKLRLQFRHLRGARLGPWCNHGHAVALGAVCRSAKNGRRHSIIQERFIRATTMSTASTTLDPGLCDCLRDVLDPEIGLNIVDLGLVIEARRSTEEVAVKLTLTSRACPLGELVIADVRERIAATYPTVARVNVDLVWDPVWTPDLITDRGYELLGRKRTRTLI